MYTETTDGHRIRLEYIAPAPRSRQAYCVLAHGIFTNRNEEILVALGAELQKTGIGSVRFDFRGHGTSHLPSTSFSPMTALEDLSAVVAWANNNADVVHIAGASFGASIVMLYQALWERAPSSRIVLLNPVVDYVKTFLDPRLDWGKELFTAARLVALREDGVARLMPHFVASRRLLNELSLLHPESLSDLLPKKTLVVHGSKDEKVPVERTIEVMSASNIEVEVVKGATHGFKDREHAIHVVRTAAAFFSQDE